MAPLTLPTRTCTYELKWSVRKQEEPRSMTLTSQLRTGWSGRRDISGASLLNRFSKQEAVVRLVPACDL